MAKVTGPLFSLEASGTVGGVVTYSQWKGRPYVRRHVIPLNPFSADQVAARNRVRCLASAVLWCNATAMVESGETLDDEARIRAITPDEFAWNGYIFDKGIGAGAVDYIAAAAAYAALQAGEKTAWVNAAAALTPAMLPVPQAIAGGGAGTPLTAGQVFFQYRWALYMMELVDIPDSTPPTYA
jgi:hypothetical protein